jgi:hypothetical protein
MFKRNQVEEAIALVLKPGSTRPSSEMRIKLKRLLETDRGLGRNKRSADPERAHFAFHSTDGPGRGVENWFSEYEAFALLIGLRLMRLGWPQGLAVAVLRRVKPALETHHARILKQAPADLSDEQRSAVVMARGIGGIKAGGLAPFAERFREEGFVTIAFDYPQLRRIRGKATRSALRPAPARGLRHRHRLGS